MLCCLVSYSHAVLLYRGKTQVVIAHHTSLTIIHSSLVCDTLNPHPVERIAILCGSWYLHLVDSCIGGYSYADGTVWVLVLALEVYLLVVWVWLVTTPLDDIVSVVWVACVTWEISKVEWRWDVRMTSSLNAIVMSWLLVCTNILYVSGCDLHVCSVLMLQYSAGQLERYAYVFIFSLCVSSSVNCMLYKYVHNLCTWILKYICCRRLYLLQSPPCRSKSLYTHPQSSV